MSCTLTTRDTSFDQCIKCTVCTVYCPVAKVNPIYPGPKQCGPDGERLRLKSPEFYDELLKMCTNCKRCEIACPSDVRIGDLIAVARGEHVHHRPNLGSARDMILSHTDLMGSLSTPVAPLVNAATSLGVVKKMMHTTLGIDHHKALPKYSFGTFRRWYKRHAGVQTQFAKQIYYFHGCYVNYNHPQLGQDLLKVLNAMNVGMQLLTKEKCCGVPLIANGFHTKARRHAKFNVQQIEHALQYNNDPLLATSSSCCYALKQEYPHVLRVDNQKVANRIQYVTQYILEALLKGTGPKLKPLPLKIAYHTPCHLARSGGHLFTISLLKQIPGIEVLVLSSDCCGSAGTYGFKCENYGTSMAIGAELFELLAQSGADYAVTDCETCSWQIEENSALKTLHPITLLAMALA